MRFGFWRSDWRITPKHPKVEIPSDKKATEYLSNERTLLAWIRTTVSIISLGFVIARFGVWLRELISRFDPKADIQNTGFSLFAGVAMMALGSVLTVLATWRYRAVNKAISRGEFQVDEGLVTIATSSVAVLGLVMIVYLLLTAKNI